MDLQLSGKVVLVTGGAGGIGQAICRAFASEGAKVAVHFHSSGDAAAELARDIGGAAFRADLTNEAEVEALFEEVIEHFGTIDVCVANAGWYPPDDAPVWELGLDRFRDVLDRNLTSAFLTAKAFLSHATATGGTHGSPTPRYRPRRWAGPSFHHRVRGAWLHWLLGWTHQRGRRSEPIGRRWRLARRRHRR